MLYVDEHKMNQVIRNLLSNAMKFTPRGGVVEIRLQLIQEHDRIEKIAHLFPVESNRDFNNSVNSSRLLSPTASSLYRPQDEQNSVSTSSVLSKLWNSTKRKRNSFRGGSTFHEDIPNMQGHGTLLISIVDSGPGVSRVSCSVFYL